MNDRAPSVSVRDDMARHGAVEADLVVARDEELMSTEKLLLKKVGAVGVITLNRPAQRNAVDAQLSEELRAAVDCLESSDDLSVGILRGAGPVFCAGMDLKAFSDGQAEKTLFGPGRLGDLSAGTGQNPSWPASMVRRWRGDSS